MNANELADVMEKYSVAGFQYPLCEEFKKAATMLRQQQAEMEELEKENTDLRYLIATKLEQQDGISLNSMAHPVTNSPEPSYKIDPDKLETIEIDLPSPEPVAWMVAEMVFDTEETAIAIGKTYDDEVIPLYTHPVKELTDEEIRHIQAICHLKDVGYDGFIMRFARAILRKAQEK